MRCTNCNIAVQRLQRHDVALMSSSLQTILSQWLAAPLPINGYICQPCLTLLNSEEAVNIRLLGHTMVCHGCGLSVRGKRHYTINADSPLLPVILSWNNHQSMSTMRYLCRVCWTRANRHLAHNISREDRDVEREQVSASLSPRQSPAAPPPLPEFPVPLVARRVLPTNNETINLPNYKRASNTSSHCIFNSCNNRSLHLIPTFIKKLMVQKFNFYVARSCRVCERHLYSNEWHTLPENTITFSSFSVRQVEDLIELAKAKSEVFDFENVREMYDSVCHYWTSLTVSEFLTLYDSIPQIDSKQPKRALAIYLAKLRTGESNRRLASVFDLPRSTFQRILTKVRNILNEHFVPVNVGVNNITRQNMIERNLMIPEALFGNPGAPLEHRPAIAIFDGTYIFMQKSANYLFQKKTYSLHKYNNLVKPFMIVACDGYIVDVVGPYPATQSDADIMKGLFQDENGPFRSLFREGDVFILDRGFRDAIPVLENLNYRIYKPETLEEGQHQLTFVQANKSRKVTLCRWVVEIVNGRFKRDFKLFRQRFFNLASPHLILDFKIAAALLNKFHPLLTNNINAEVIIERVQRFMNEPNHLGQFVEDYSINRRRVMFTRIDGNLPQLQEFPVFSYEQLLLFSLGPYQVKQARSYYGEHIRQNGMYEIEVCPELEHSAEMILRVGGNHPYLLRGRIKSRHISQRLYFTYILFDREPTGNCPLEAILGYYCNCLVGNRTVGCCCHVMTLVWYLGWARYQTNITSPASFLDDILITIDET